MRRLADWLEFAAGRCLALTFIAIALVTLPFLLFATWWARRQQG